jgi:hypothetical protein
MRAACWSVRSTTTTKEDEMSTTETTPSGQPLQAAKYPYGPSDKFTVTDANDTVVRQGDICRVIKATNWLQVDELIRATGPATFDNDGGIYYYDTKLSSSALRKDSFVVVTDRESRTAWELAVALYRRAVLAEQVAKASAELHRVEREIGRLQSP